jgi:precorrin-3B C17-methyltransferase
VVGIGPGDPADRTFREEDALLSADTIVGYSTYIDLISDLIQEDQEVIASGMRQEVQRCRQAIELAASGRTVALVSSGDSGIYGMAGLVYEILDSEKKKPEVEIVCGITASSAAAAVLGAPLMLDYAVISLSDLLVSWEMIEKRLRAAAEADLVTVFYNPKSQKRSEQIKKTREIFLNHRPPSTPVGIVTRAGMQDEAVVISDLEHFLDHPIDMRSVVVVGNSSTAILNGKMVTKRGYQV